MKTILKNIIGIFISLLVFVACTDESEIVLPDNDNGVITLALENSKLSRSVPTEGSDAFNENTLSKVDVFVYKQGDTETCLASVLGVSATGGKVTIKVPMTLKNTTFSVYVLANLPASFDYRSKSLSDLQQGSIVAAFDGSKIETSFVMDGLQEVAGGFEALTGAVNVKLSRAASKITLTADVKESITDKNTGWEANLKNMKIRLYNGVKNSYVNTVAFPFVPKELDFVKEMTTNLNIATGEKYTHIPFYSYTNSWANNQANETYLLLEVPWRKKTDSSAEYKMYYYRVAINKLKKELVRNNWYHIDLTVSILGSEEIAEPVELDATCTVMNWSNVTIDADLTTPQYLVVDQQNVTMNNLEEYRVKYASSSKIKFKLIKVWRPTPPFDPAHSSLFNEQVGEEEKDITDAVKSDITFIDNGDDTFTIQHKFINNKASQDMRNHYFRPWHFQFEVLSEHFPNEGQGEVVEVTQYPAIYVVADNNVEGGSNCFINNHNHQGTTNTAGFDGLYDLNDPTITNNWNRNQYVIYTTVLGDEYQGKVVGNSRDFRSKSFDGLVADSKGNNLKYYYPAQSVGVDNMIAPAFRIASSWGQSNTMTYDNAVKRCAAYQENGYPAGRWRLPTEAEIEYIASLSQNYYKSNYYLNKDGFLPMLLNGNYWASSGRYYNSLDLTFNAGTISVHTRCVYDTWYWGDKKEESLTTFVWGDKRF